MKLNKIKAILRTVFVCNFIILTNWATSWALDDHSGQQDNQSPYQCYWDRPVFVSLDSLLDFLGSAGVDDEIARRDNHIDGPSQECEPRPRICIPFSDGFQCLDFSMTYCYSLPPEQRAQCMVFAAEGHAVVIRYQCDGDEIDSNCQFCMIEPIADPNSPGRVIECVDVIDDSGQQALIRAFCEHLIRPGEIDRDDKIEECVRNANRRYFCGNPGEIPDDWDTWPECNNPGRQIDICQIMNSDPQCNWDSSQLPQCSSIVGNSCNSGRDKSILCRHGTQAGARMNVLHCINNQYVYYVDYTRLPANYQPDVNHPPTEELPAASVH